MKEYRLTVFEKRGLREINGAQKDEAAGEQRRVHSEDFHDFCSPTNIFCMIKSRRMGQSWHFRHMGREKLHVDIWLKNLRKRDHLVDSGTDRRILKKKKIFKK